MLTEADEIGYHSRNAVCRIRIAVKRAGQGEHDHVRRLMKAARNDLDLMEFFVAVAEAQAGTRSSEPEREA